jgi:hypothetical protein
MRMSKLGSFDAFHLTTSIIIVVTIIGLIAWDIATINIAGVDTSISRISIKFMELNPELALACGGLVGHLTWSTNAPTNRTRELILLITSLLALAAMDVFHVLPPMMPLWPFLVGIPVGHALWGQCLSPVQRIARAISP